MRQIKNMKKAGMCRHSGLVCVCVHVCVPNVNHYQVLIAAHDVNYKGSIPQGKRKIIISFICKSMKGHILETSKSKLVLNSLTFKIHR